MTKHTPPLDIATLRRDAKAGYESPDPDVSILARNCFVLLARLEQAQGERDALRQQVAAMREATQEAILQIEYLHQKFQETGSGNQVVARLRAIAATQETP